MAALTVTLTLTPDELADLASAVASLVAVRVEAAEAAELGPRLANAACREAAAARIIARALTLQHKVAAAVR